MCLSYIATDHDPTMDPIPFVHHSASPSKDIKTSLQDAAHSSVCTGSSSTYLFSDANFVNSTSTEELKMQTYFRTTKLLARQYIDKVQEPRVRVKGASRLEEGERTASAT